LAAGLNRGETEPPQNKEKKMSGNWLRTSVIGLSLALFFPAAASAQSGGTSATLDTVVVTASRTEEKLREVASNVTVITEDMIKKSSAPDMRQLLRQQGIEVGSGTTTLGSQQVVLRGMRATWEQGAGDLTSPTLILLNGRRIGGPSPEFIGLANVERIEIIRGPAAVQYGPSAMSGVVNIITKRGGEKPEIMAEAGAGSFDLERLKLAASGQSGNGRVDFSFGAGQQYQGDYKTGEGWVWEHGRDGNKQGVNADVGLNLEEGHRLGVNYYYSGVLGAALPNNQSSPFNPAVKPADTGYYEADTKLYNTAITYDGSTEDKAWRWQGRFGFGQYVYDQYAYTSYPGRSKYTTDMKNLTGILGYDAGGLFALSGGLDYQVYEMDNETPYSASTPEYKDFGAFLSGKLRFLEDSLIFSAGGRFDEYELERGTASDNASRSETNFSPSVGLAYLPVDWLKLRTNFSRGFRMPTVSQLYQNHGTVYANPDLKPEKSKTWEVGVDASWAFLNAGLTYFHSKYVDKIQGVPTGRTWPDPSTRNINLTGATIAGYELALSADLGQAMHQDWTLRPYVNLTYLSTLRNEDYASYPSNYWSVPGQNAKGFDETFPFVSRMTMSYGLDFVEPNIDLLVNVNASYGGEQLSADWTQDTSAPPYGKMMHHTPGTVVGMTVEQGIWKFADMGKIKVRAEVNNLFDADYRSGATYPGPGRNYYVGLKYEY
jgi:vitamin B12 transporter